MSDIQKLHEEVWLLLPWYLNNTLQPAENDLVAEHLRTCLVCRREFEYLHFQAEMIRGNEYQQSSPQHSFEKLMRRITSDNHAYAYGARFILQIRRLIQRIMLSGKNMSPAHAMVWMLPILIAGLFFLWAPVDERVAIYHTLSDSVEDTGHVAGYIRLVVDKQITVEQLHELMRSCRVEVARGPSTIGAYTLHTKTGQSSDNALACLRKIKFVQLAEPVQ